MKFSFKKLIPFALLLVAGLALGVFIRYRMYKANEKNITIASTLTDFVSMSELYTAEYTYSGIADIDRGGKKDPYHVCYEALVKAGVDLNKILFEVDMQNKIIYATLPDIDLEVSIVNEESMKLLPTNANVELDVLLKSSKKDAETEVNDTTGLKKVARENAEATIHGLLYPILKSENYSLIWK